jgi:hypothetical protein
MASSADWDAVTRVSYVSSHAITAENPTGAKGAGGTAASALGPGRKGKAYLPLPARGKATNFWATPTL